MLMKIISNVQPSVKLDDTIWYCFRVKFEIEDEIEDSFILEEWLSAKKSQKVTIRVPQKGEK